MDTNNENLIKDFFTRHRTIIDDAGFSKRVMNNLSQKRRNSDWIIVVFTFLGIFVSLALMGTLNIIQNFQLIISSISISVEYLLISIAVSPLVFIFLFSIRRKKLF